jgi:hypothetical protein
MKGWLKTICFNRKACVVLGGNQLSEIFDLGRGNAQGDNISPFIFIICYQILLFRIEFDNGIEGVVEEPVPPDLYQPPPHQVCPRAKKIFAYADDANCLLQFTGNTLTALRTALDEFAVLSGLECNVEKTTLMQVGSKLAPTQDILDLGFDIKEKVTILGMVIVNDSGSYETNVSNIQT